MTPRSYIRTRALSRVGMTFFVLQKQGFRPCRSHKKQFRFCAIHGSQGCNSAGYASGCVSHEMGQFAADFGTIRVNRNPKPKASEVSSKANSRRSYGSDCRPKVRRDFGRVACARRGVPKQHRPQTTRSWAPAASGIDRSEPRDSAGPHERTCAPRSRDAFTRTRVAGDGSFRTSLHAGFQRTLDALRLPALWVVEALPSRRHVPSLPTVAGGVLC